MPEENKRITEEDRINYLNFCCGMLLGTLTALRPEVSDAGNARINFCLEMVNPLIAKVYEFQAKPL